MTVLVDRRPIDAIVMGGSAGSLEVLRQCFSRLSPRLPVPIIVVVHVPARSPTRLEETFQHHCSWPMKQPQDKEAIKDGAVYFAPSDYHLLIEKQRSFALSVDDPVNFSRPSIDVLFDSACDVYGDRLLGVLLSGASVDGAGGLANIHAAGGRTLVQTPASAEMPTMPEAAIARFTPSYVLAPEDIGAFFGSLHE